MVSFRCFIRRACFSTMRSTATSIAASRPHRPIPAGEVDLDDGVCGRFGSSRARLRYSLRGRLRGTRRRRLARSGRGRVLAAIIVLYDAWHKANPVGPRIMGLCRLLVYVDCRAFRCGSLARSRCWSRHRLALLSRRTHVAAKQESLRRVDNRLAATVSRRTVCLRLPLRGCRSVAALILYLLLLAAVVAALLLLFRPRGARCSARDHAAHCRHQPARRAVHGRLRQPRHSPPRPLLRFS